MATTSAPGTEFSTDLADTLIGEGIELPPGLGPWKLAARRLRRNKVSLFFGGVFLVIVLLCLLAPVYAHYVAHHGPAAEDITGKVNVGGKPADIVSPTGIPVGPTWHSKYFLGADANGRDVAVRLLYGGGHPPPSRAGATPVTLPPPRPPFGL